MDNDYSFLGTQDLGSLLNEFISCPCYIISFILNSRFGSAIGYESFLLLLAKTLAHQSASARPPCSKAAILFYPTAVSVPANSLPIHKICQKILMLYFLVYVLSYRLLSNMRLSRASFTWSMSTTNAGHFSGVSPEASGLPVKIERFSEP